MELLANGDLSAWKKQVFEKVERHTDFELVEEQDGPQAGKVLEAVAVDSASGYIIEDSLPFSADAVMRLSYKVIEAANPADEKTKEGDDFALRFYLTSKNLLLYRTLILVHSNQYPTGENWESPYSGTLAKFDIHAISSSGDKGRWLEVEVPVGKLWQASFGDVPDELVGVAFMVDSDNAHGKMHTRISRITYSP